MKDESVVIVNLRNTKTYDFRCDRYSPVGNPFTMHSESERNSVCDKYEEHFLNTMTNGVFHDSKFVKYIESIIKHHKQHGKVTLACWCSPKRCHCETIRTWVLNH